MNNRWESNRPARRSRTKKGKTKTSRTTGIELNRFLKEQHPPRFMTFPPGSSLCPEHHQFVSSESSPRKVASVRELHGHWVEPRGRPRRSPAVRRRRRRQVEVDHLSHHRIALRLRAEARDHPGGRRRWRRRGNAATAAGLDHDLVAVIVCGGARAKATATASGSDGTKLIFQSKERTDGRTHNSRLFFSFYLCEGAPSSCV